MFGAIKVLIDKIIKAKDDVATGEEEALILSTKQVQEDESRETSFEPPVIFAKKAESLAQMKKEQALVVTEARSQYLEKINRNIMALKCDSKTLMKDHIKGWFRKRLIIDYGTKAFLIKNGKTAQVFEPGVYEANHFHEKVGDLTIEYNPLLVLINEPDTDLTFDNIISRASDHHQVNCRANIVVSVADPAQFAKAMNFQKLADASLTKKEKKNDPWLLYKKVTEQGIYLEIEEEVEAVIHSFVKEHPVDQLLTNLALRKELEVRLNTEISQTLSRFGLKIVALRLLKITSDELDAVYEEAADRQVEFKRALNEVEAYEQKVELSRRLRELTNLDKIAEASSDTELEDFYKQALHESKAKDILRDEELAELERTAARNKDDYEFSRMQILRTSEQQLEHTLQLAEADQAIKLGEKSTELVQLEMRERQIRFEQDMAEQRLQHLENIKNQEAKFDLSIKQDEHDLRIADIAQRQTIERKILKDREEMLIRLEEEKAKAELEMKRHQMNIELLKAQPDIDADKLLAMGAMSNPALAQALVEKAKVSGQAVQEKADMQKEMMDKQEAMFSQVMDRFSDQSKHAMDAMSTFSGHRSSSSAPEKAEEKEAVALLCPECNTENLKDSNFCQKCGKKLR